MTRPAVQLLRDIGLPVLQGILFFGVLMGVCMAIVAANARFIPAVPWFAVPVIALIVIATAGAERHWRIGLGQAPANPRRAYLLAFVASVLGVAACALQGAFHGMVRMPEPPPAGVNALFGAVYVLVMSAVAAVLAEVSFRGIIQTRWQQHWSPWVTILAVAAVNTAAHRWGPALGQQWLGLFVAVGAMAWLRQVTGSLWPPLVAHVVVNLLLALALMRWQSFDQGAIGAGGIALLVGLLLVSTATAAVLVAPRRQHILERGL